jgi:hypothetical protein
MKENEYKKTELFLFLSLMALVTKLSSQFQSTVSVNVSVKRVWTRVTSLAKEMEL